MPLFAAVRYIRVGSQSTKHLLRDLACRVNEKDECWPTRGSMAFACETSRSTIDRSLRTLERLGVIERIEQKAGGARRPTLIRLDSELIRKFASEIRALHAKGYRHSMQHVRGTLTELNYMTPGR